MHPFNLTCCSQRSPPTTQHSIVERSGFQNIPNEVCEKKTLKKWRHKISNTLLVAIKNKLILTIADPVRKSLLGSNWQSQTVAKRRKVHSLKVWQRIFYIKIKKWTCRVILIKYPYNLRGIIWCQYPIINVRSIVKW